MRNSLIIMIALMACVPFSVHGEQQYGAGQNTTEPAASQGQQKTVIGVVVNADIFNKTLTVLDTWQRPIQFKTRNAEISVSNESTEAFAILSDIKPGDNVQITFTGSAGDPHNLKIILLPYDQRDVYFNGPWVYGNW